jgi:hypothetical protein
LVTISAITGELFVYLESMISSEEFQQTLQSGQIHEALALLVRDSVELDITTHLTDDSRVDSQTNNQTYLRTKINFLTGEIHNEVGQGFVANCAGYLKLQQLHIDQVIANDRLVQGYFEQIKAILTTLASTTVTQPLPSVVEPTRLNANALIARLTEAAALSTQSSVASSAKTPLSSTDQLSQSSAPATIEANIEATSEEDIDLSLEAEGEVWEEWVEDEDFSAASMLFQPALSMVPKPDSEENWVRRHLNSIEAKPQNQHSVAESANIANQWDQFKPDWIDIELQPQTAKNSDIHR